jgi:hypothetical protein
MSSALLSPLLLAQAYEPDMLVLLASIASETFFICVIIIILEPSWHNRSKTESPGLPDRTCRPVGQRNRPSNKLNRCSKVVRRRAVKVV